MAGVHDFTATSIDGSPVSLETYRAHAPHRQRREPVRIHAAIRRARAALPRVQRRWVHVLGFPCDQFGHQEPGTDAEIQRFCSTTYDVTFPLFSKIKVNGPDAHPLFAFLEVAEEGIARPRSDQVELHEVSRGPRRGRTEALRIGRHAGVNREGPACASICFTTLTPSDRTSIRNGRCHRRASSTPSVSRRSRRRADWRRRPSGTAASCARDRRPSPSGGCAVRLRSSRWCADWDRTIRLTSSTRRFSERAAIC